MKQHLPYPRASINNNLCPSPPPDAGAPLPAGRGRAVMSVYFLARSIAIAVASRQKDIGRTGVGFCAA